VNAYWRLFLSPRGITGRRTYWHGVIVIVFINCVLLLGSSALAAAAPQPVTWICLAGFPTLWFSICVTAKRLRAVGASPWVQAPVRLAVAAGLIGGAIGVNGTATGNAGLLFVLLFGLGMVGLVADFMLLVWLGALTPAQPAPSMHEAFD